MYEGKTVGNATIGAKRATWFCDTIGDGGREIVLAVQALEHHREHKICKQRCLAKGWKTGSERIVHMEEER